LWITLNNFYNYLKISKIGVTLTPFLKFAKIPLDTTFSVSLQKAPQNIGF